LYSVSGSKTLLQLALLCVAVATAGSQGPHAAPFDEATERYRGYMIADMDRALAGSRQLRDDLNAKDIAAAKEAWIKARIGWERSEVFTSAFIPELDDAIDAWPDSVAGFHGIEAKLFGADPGGFGDVPDKLVGHLTEADTQVRTMPLTPQGLLDGATRLSFEVGDSKVDGGESRLSGTSLDDMRNNADGIELAYRILFAPSLEGADPQLAVQIRDGIDKLKTILEVQDLRQVDPDDLQKTSEALVVAWQAAGPKLGLATPTLEGPVK
jgi:iron uptake system EfeUOB component EfeO/EfeM